MVERTRVIAVIGGTGFIGSRLVRTLLDRGHRVRAVSRHGGGLQSHRSLEVVRASLADGHGLSDAVQDAEVVFHLATGGGDTWAQFQRDFVDGTRRLACACLDARVPRLVYVSSIAALYLGRRRRVDEFERVDPKPDRRGHYSRAKILTEAMLADLRRERGLPVVIVRPGIVVGRGGPLTHSGIGQWQSDLHCLGWGFGAGPLPFVLVDDVVEALCSAMNAPGIEGRTYNLVGEVRPSAREFVRLLARESRRRVRFHPRPLLGLQAAEGVRWLLKALARKPENRLTTLRHLRSAALRSAIDCSAARRDLRWTPTADPEQFIREAIRANVPPISSGDLRAVERPW